MCHKLNVKFGIVSVALNNCLSDDDVELMEGKISQFEQRLFWLNLVFIKDSIVRTIPTNSMNDNSSSSRLCVELWPRLGK